MNEAIREEFNSISTTLWWKTITEDIERRKQRLLTDLARCETWEEAIRLQARYDELFRIIEVITPNDF